jgi:hypothetical protein
MLHQTMVGISSRGLSRRTATGLRLEEVHIPALLCRSADAALVHLSSSDVTGETVLKLVHFLLPHSGRTSPFPGVSAHWCCTRSTVSSLLRLMDRQFHQHHLGGACHHGTGARDRGLPPPRDCALHGARGPPSCFRYYSISEVDSGTTAERAMWRGEFRSDSNGTPSGSAACLPPPPPRQDRRGRRSSAAAAIRIRLRSP